MAYIFGSTSLMKSKGIVHPDSYFKIVEKNKIDWQLWIDVLQGKVAGAIFRDVFNQELRQQVCYNFWNSLTLKQQTDGLPPSVKALLGTSLEVITTNPLEVYFEEVKRTRKDIQSLFANTGDFFVFLIDNINEHLAAQGCSLRLAEYNGLKTGEYKMRSWGNTGTFVVAPHDDAGILGSPRMKDFEIGHLLNGRTVGVNICIENGEGGNLCYWNISPNDETRKALGFENDGFGYSLEYLANFDEVSVSIFPGDIYLFDTAKVHAIGRKTKDEENRLTVSWSMGLLNPTTFLYWG
ncbi:hypothetical protein [Coleofasciculus sp.]|uniref:hypothetical protein n=1 Tax=Coleofasciculus sp. TaxID=3100458 RepID=UPI003A4927DB